MQKLYKNYVQYFEGKENRIARENPIPKSEYSDIQYYNF